MSDGCIFLIVSAGIVNRTKNRVLIPI